MAKFLFVCGGVMSGIGKGVSTASIGRILKSRGFKVTAVKIDPYINVDAGTMNPIEHGEVFVTEDGMECDQDIGNYERFLDENIPKENYMTTGAVYKTVIERERNLEYNGKCVEVVPHIPEEVLHRLEIAAKKAKADFVLIEIGGTVGEYQNLLFLEAGRMLKLRRPNDVLFVLVSYLPVPEIIGEMKTKPTQYAVRSLNYAGIQPDIIIARSTHALDEPRKRKIGVFCNVDERDVISAPDINSIYEIPINFERDQIGDRILKKFKMPKRPSRMDDWKKLVQRIKKVSKPVHIGIVGKYFESGNFTLSDSYLSVIEAVKHASWRQGVKPKITWLDSERYEKNPRNLVELQAFDGLIIPGGFGKRGVEGKIKAIEFARTRKIPFLGLCYGLQLAVIEFARNICKLKDASTTEISPQTKNPVITTMTDQKELISNKKMGGSMRLGAYECLLLKGTKGFAAYSALDNKIASAKAPVVLERHRHRYEVNNNYRTLLEKNGMKISGINLKKNLIEMIEIKNHPFFIGTQFHPELKSRPLEPHPLFVGFIKYATNKKRN